MSPSLRAFWESHGGQRLHHRSVCRVGGHPPHVLHHTRTTKESSALLAVGLPPRAPLHMCVTLYGPIARLWFQSPHLLDTRSKEQAPRPPGWKQPQQQSHPSLLFNTRFGVSISGDLGTSPGKRQSVRTGGQSKHLLKGRGPTMASSQTPCEPREGQGGTECQGHVDNQKI